MGSVYPGDSLERVQAVQVEIMMLVSEICDEFGLTWFADSGTCLGAVRHGGFIPWDDDIDIAMPLDDYLVFRKVAPRVLEGSGYGVYTPETTENYPPLFLKVYKEGTRFIGEQMMEAGLDEGIFIDVFAYGQLDSNESKAMGQVRRLVFWQRMSYLYHIAHPHIPAQTPLRPLASAAAHAAHGIVRRVVKPEGILRRFEAVIREGDGKGRWTNVFYANYGTFSTDELFPVVERRFGEFVVPVPHDADAYLTTVYGDYMEFPPESERFTKPPLVLDFGDGVNVIEEARAK